MIYNIEELIAFARENSPFYKELYKDLGSISLLSSLPIINQEKFWKSNNFSDNKLLTGDFSEGILFKSGGTSGKPKFSAFTDLEWNMFTTEFGHGISKGLLKDGDYVGNLFYAGELYASFAFIMKSLENGPNKIVQFPMTGAMSDESIVKTINEYKINVLAGVPTTFMNLAEYVVKNNLKVNLDLILFGGESLYPDQLNRIKEAFPSAEVNSIGIASVDGGHLGYYDETCENGEHKVFEESTIVEIIDEVTNEVIVEAGKTGRLIYTNLTRKLMPIIRYPAGDRAEWIEVNSKYKLHGRSDEGARVGPVSIGTDDILNIFNLDNLGCSLNSFQLCINRKDGLDQLTILLVPESETIASKLNLLELLYTERPMFKKAVQDHIISAPIVKITELSDLTKNKRTGKQRLVVDLRDHGNIT